MRRRVVGPVVACGLLLSCAGSSEEEFALALAPIPRPAAGVEVLPGSDLQAILDEVEPGAVLCLGAGSYDGPLVFRRPVTLWGPPEAVIRSTGKGTTLAVDANGVGLLGFTVDGTGGRFDLLDSAVRVRADEVRIEGLRIVNALFGILVEQSNRVVIRGNRVIGTGQDAFGLRGDGIRLWETRDSVVEGNHVSDCRDTVVWYSSNNRVLNNLVERSRYGTHLMYSHENVVEGNRYIDDVVGIFVMYSRDVAIRHNVLARASGAAGIGLGVKESGNLTVSENAFLVNTTGVYLDTSPLNIDHQNVFERNVFRLSDTAVAFHAAAHRNTFRGNSFRDNRTQVRVGGGGHALDALWVGNDFDDYVGYDLDGDGVGDVPYELRSLASNLTGRYPELAFYQGTAALELIDVVGRVVPLFTPKQVLVDEQPRLAALVLDMEQFHAR